jgi:hypothetical protein
MKLLDDEAMPAPPGLPPFAPVAACLLDIVSRQDDVAGEAAELLGLEGGFVATLLRADSPGDRQIRTLARAIAWLGAGRVRALAATLGPLPMSGYWRHSAESAFVAVEVAAARGVHPGHASTAAILDDSGAPCPPADVAAPQPGMPAQALAVESLIEAVGAASCMPLLQPCREDSRPDPAKLARALKVETGAIYN